MGLDDEVAAAEAEPDDGPEAPEPAQQPVDEGRVVAVTQPQVSSRAQKAAKLAARLDTLERTTSEELAKRDREIARLQGMAEARAQMPVYQPQPAPAPVVLPDPDVLEEEAAKLLDGPKPDFKGYQRKMREAAVAAMQRQYNPQFQQINQRFQQQPQSQGQIPAALIPHWSANPKIAALGFERAGALLGAKNTEAEMRGIPPGPGRLDWVFAEANKVLEGANGNGNGTKKPTYGNGVAGALSSAPSGRNGGGGDSATPGVKLTADELKWAAKSGMTTEEYARDIATYHPERVQRG